MTSRFAVMRIGVFFFEVSFSCVFLFLFVLGRLFVVCLFLFVVLWVWRCRVVVVRGCCVRLLVRSLVRWCGAVLLLVVVLRLLLLLSRVWSVLWCVFVLAGVRLAGLFGLSLCLLCADSFLSGALSPFFRAIAFSSERSLSHFQAIALVEEIFTLGIFF